MVGRDQGCDQFDYFFVLGLGAQIPEREFESSIGDVQCTVADRLGYEFGVQRVAAYEFGLDAFKSLVYLRRIAIGGGFGDTR